MHTEPTAHQVWQRPDAALIAAKPPSLEPAAFDPARVLFEQATDRLDWISHEGLLVTMNDAGCQALEMTASRCRALPWLNLWSPESRNLVAARMAAAQAGRPTRFMAASDMGSGRRWWDVVLSKTPAGLLAQARDVSILTAAIEGYRYRARHDELTGLLNRAAFKDVATIEIEKNALHERMGVVLMIDLDNFKLINDTLGHDAGDLVLRAVANGLHEIVGDDGFASRLGGDEFAVVLPKVGDFEQLRIMIEALLERIARPVDAKDTAITPRASIGAALFPKHGNTPAALLKNADIALYAAKSFGRGGYVVFTPSMGGPIRRRAAAAATLRLAIASDRVDARYQPIVNLASRRVLGFEAKLNVLLPNGQPMPATDIRSVYDDVDLAQALGDHMLAKIAADAQRWRDSGLALTRIAINANAAEFRTGNYAGRFLKIIGNAGLSPDLFEIEVAETVFAGRATDYIAAALKTLRSAGARISLVEFGSGPASLSHLKHLPIDAIKIDGAFVEAVENDPGDGAIVRAMIGLANGFGIGLAADGINTSGQAETLARFGCKIGQGDLFGPASSAANVAEIFSNTSKFH